jgi:hypothetical protein
MFCFPLLTLLLSFIINGSFIGRYIGHRGSKVIIISISLCFITLILCFITLILCFITLILCFITLILCFITLISSMIIWYEVIYGGCEESHVVKRGIYKSIWHLDKCRINEYKLGYLL